MQVNLKGQQLRLRGLNDREFEEAARMARVSTPPDQCPTCGARETEIPDSGGVKQFVNGTYKLHGVVYPCDCQAQIALRARYLLAGIGEQYMRLDWNDFDGSEEARKMVATYLDNWENFKRHGWGLEFGGPLGVGKTFAATHIGKELVKLRQRVYFLRFSKMISTYDSPDGDEIERRIRETNYVILDELVPPISDAQHSLFSVKLETMIRHRTDHNLPTIITTNLTQKELSGYYPRTYSLLAAKQDRIEMTGDDQRRARISFENRELIENGEVRPIS